MRKMHRDYTRTRTTGLVLIVVESYFASNLVVNFTQKYQATSYSNIVELNINGEIIHVERKIVTTLHTQVQR